MTIGRATSDLKLLKTDEVPTGELSERLRLEALRFQRSGVPWEMWLQMSQLERNAFAEAGLSRDKDIAYAIVDALIHSIGDSSKAEDTGSPDDKQANDALMEGVEMMAEKMGVA